MLTMKKEMKEIKSAKELNEVMTEQLKEMKKNPEVLAEIFNLQSIINFGNFSFSNYCLTKFQMKHAEMIKGFKQWEKLNRRVKRGVKALYIYAPQFTSKKTLEVLKDSAKTEQNPAIKEKIQKKIDWLEKSVRFNLVPVFDVSQTEGEPIANANETTGAKFIESEQGPFLTSALLEKITEFLTGVNIGVTYETHYKMAGALSHNGRTGAHKIVLAEGIEPAGTLATMFHEIGHYKFNHISNGAGQEIEEGQAEIFSYLVSKYFGINTDKATGAYLAHYLETIDNGKIFQNFQSVVKTAVEFVKELENWKETGKAELKQEKA
jgi:hypothetical protein